MWPGKRWEMMVVQQHPAAGISIQELLRGFGRVGTSPGWVLRTGRRPLKGH